MVGDYDSFTGRVVAKKGAVPKLFRPRPVPFALKEPVEREIHHLEELGILERVNIVPGLLQSW